MLTKALIKSDFEYKTTLRINILLSIFQWRTAVLPREYF